ncbi:MAG: ABC transporter permease [Methylobacterium mesophilicum]|nr:ABC transporter permease [Methylobacterium mesophilicum]
MPLLLFGVVTVAFFLTRFTHADPLTSLVGERQLHNVAVVEAAKARWGLDRSVPEQYLVYLRNLLGGDFGISFRTKQPVAQDLAARFPATLELVVCAMIFGSVTGIGLGVLAAEYRDRAIDHIARGVALIGSSIPIFWLGLALMYVFSVKMGWLPGPGRLDARVPPPPYVTGMFTVDALLAGDLAVFGNALSHLVLPTVALGWSVTGIVSRMVRGSMLDVLSQEYILSARAKGARRLRVLFNHALRNAILPTLTILGFSFAYLLTGAILTETIFAWPGIGSYSVAAARGLDYPAIIAVSILGGAAFLVTNLAVDLIYLVVDPRLRLSGKPA